MNETSVLDSIISERKPAALRPAKEATQQTQEARKAREERMLADIAEAIDQAVREGRNQIGPFSVCDGFTPKVHQTLAGLGYKIESANGQYAVAW